jgi:hypothetical protein
MRTPLMPLVRLATLAIAALPVAAQDFTVANLSRHILTNESVVTLARAGFDESFIADRIRKSRTRFDLSVEGMVALKQAGISEELIQVMAENERRASPAAQPAPAPVPAAVQPAAAAVAIERHWWGIRWKRIAP